MDPSNKRPPFLNERPTMIGAHQGVRQTLLLGATVSALKNRMAIGFNFCDGVVELIIITSHW
uniref:Uncharacterized protein n=1 Tax=Rhizophora mucronata TaxID=61149 RepID=A0A2P2LBP2_RHIMU